MDATQNEEAFNTPGARNAAGCCAESLTPQRVLEIMDRAQSIVISGHINPDGDALGSALALRDLLRKMNKEVVVVLGQEHPAPELYDFLPDYEFIAASAYTGTPDLFIVVDASTAKRLGSSERFLELAQDTLVIDHHTNYEHFAHNYFGDDTAPATATLIWSIIKASPLAPTLNMAIYCYVGIMTDTGRFAFINTNHTAFADAMEMVDLGVDPSRLSELVYENKTIGAMRLESLLIKRVRFACSERIAYSFILQKDLEAHGLPRDATEQLPTILRSIKGVEVAVLFRDEENEGVRVNLRSRSSFNVGAFACALGGGGHAGAAGLTLEMPLEDAIDAVVSKLESELTNTPQAKNTLTRS